MAALSETSFLRVAYLKADTRRKLAWSRMGAIAYITSDSRFVKICCLQFKSDEANWGWTTSDFTEPSLRDHILRSTYRGYDFTHVSWSPSGMDLLIIDSSGRIAVAIVFIALNRLAIPKWLNNEPEDNLNAVVGLKWLEFKRRVNSPCTSHYTVPYSNCTGGVGA